MRILVSQKAESAQRSFPGGADTAYEIPNGTITWITIVYLLINVSAGVLSNYFSSKPDRDLNEFNTTLMSQNFRLQILQRVLESENPQDRKNSLILLLKTDLLTEKNDTQLLDFLSSKAEIPKWPVRTLEPLSSYLNVATFLGAADAVKKAPPPGLTPTSSFQPKSDTSTSR